MWDRINIQGGGVKLRYYLWGRPHATVLALPGRVIRVFFWDGSVQDFPGCSLEDVQRYAEARA